MDQVLILGVRRFDFIGKEGNHIQGVQVSYITDDVADEPQQRGCTPFTVSAPASIWPELQDLPAFYDVDFRQRPGLKGKPTLQMVAARFSKSLKGLLSPVPLAPKGSG